MEVGDLNPALAVTAMEPNPTENQILQYIYRVGQNKGTYPTKKIQLQATPPKTDTVVGGGPKIHKK